MTNYILKNFYSNFPSKNLSSYPFMLK